MQRCLNPGFSERIGNSRRTGSSRNAILSVVGFFIVGALLLTRVDVAEGQRVAGAGLLSSTLFFVLTNFGVWAFGNGTIYPHTASGLVECYVMALPFFRNSLISMALFLPVLFSRISLTVPELTSVAPLVAQRG